MNRRPPLQLLVCFLALQLALPAWAAPEGWSPLLEPPTLAKILEQAPETRIVHVTGDYAAGHIPGAVEATYSDFRGPRHNPGELPDVEALTNLVRALGINADTPAVLVHGGASAADLGAAARVYWTLKSLGVKDLAVLNGGFKTWREQALPVSTETHSVTATDFSPHWRDNWRVSTEEIEGLVTDGSARLVDARTPGFFTGLQASSARPGTIQGASNLSFTEWFEGTHLKAPEQLSHTVEDHGSASAPVTVSFCNTGHLAAINWFVMSEVAGIENTRLYAESMTEWSMADRPMDNEPSRIRHYWDMTTRWFTEFIES